MAKKETEATRERRWQAEDDARVLTQVGEITGDVKRLKRAKAEAERLLKKKRQEVISLEKIAKKPVNTRIKRSDGKILRIKSDKTYH